MTRSLSVRTWRRSSQRADVNQALVSGHFPSGQWYIFLWPMALRKTSHGTTASGISRKSPFSLGAYVTSEFGSPNETTAHWIQWPKHCPLRRNSARPLVKMIIHPKADQMLDGCRIPTGNSSSAIFIRILKIRETAVGLISVENSIIRKER